jgi:glutathione S-transferase
MLTIWGRATSSNVQKVLWCCDELGLAYERIEAGREFGRVGDAAYQAMNPNALVPTLVDGDLVVWESNAILRYLCNRYGGERLYPADPAARSRVDQWLDWQLTTMIPAIAPVFWALVRPPAGGSDMKAVAVLAEKLAQVWTLLDRQLADRPYVAGETLSLADLALGNSIRRWYFFALERPELPHVAAWYQRLGDRPGFRTHVMAPVV